MMLSTSAYMLAGLNSRGPGRWGTPKSKEIRGRVGRNVSFIILTSFEKVKGGQGGTSTQSPTAQLAYHECTAGSTLQKMYCHANILQFLLLDLILLTFSTIKLVKRPFVAEESAMHM
jgi:hypothetical protein